MQLQKAVNLAVFDDGLVCMFRNDGDEGVFSS